MNNFHRFHNFRQFHNLFLSLSPTESNIECAYNSLCGSMLNWRKTHLPISHVGLRLPSSVFKLNSIRAWRWYARNQLALHSVFVLPDWLCLEAPIGHPLSIKHSWQNYIIGKINFFATLSPHRKICCFENAHAKTLRKQSLPMSRFVQGKGFSTEVGGKKKVEFWMR